MVTDASAATTAGFTVVHEFQGGPEDGSQSHGSLTVAGETLVGHSYLGGANNLGAIFQINTDGTGLRLVHSFAGGPSDGAGPRHDSILLSGSTLFGTTAAGGARNIGTIYRLEIDGAGFRRGNPALLILAGGAAGWAAIR